MSEHEPTDPQNEVTQFVGTKSEEVSRETDTLRQVGAQLGEFRLLRRLGKGGMAEVWLAEQTSLKRNVALKLLRSDMMEDETYVKRFQTEAKAAAGLNHPNIVQVYTVGCEKGQHFIAQEYVHGQTLKDLIKKKGALEVPLALHLMKQVVSALHTAAERGIVHRDIKPENIMLTKKVEAKVADFGLAQLQGGERLNLTQEGVTMGTPLYMSPEQVTGRPLDQRSDIYSFGVTCYHMLTGSPPFQGENAVSVAVKHLHDAAKPLREVRDDLPQAICRIVERMMAKSPEKRYQTSLQVLNDIRRVSKALKNGELTDEFTTSGGHADPFPVRFPTWSLIGLCLLVATIGASSGWLLRAGVPEPQLHLIDSSIPLKESARDQFMYAMFEIDNEDAFLKVLQEFKDPKDVIWRNRTHEQLALLYLKDRYRADDALRELNVLNLINTPPYFHAVSRIGQAYLAVRDDNLDGVRKARTILQSSAAEIEKYATGSWKQIEEDIRRLIEKENS